MAEEIVKKEKWSDKLHNKYRLVVMNDDTLAEVVSYKLTRMNVYLLLSSILVMIVILVTMVIFYTPIRQYVPGYGDYNRRQQIIALYETVDSLQKLQESSDVYARSVKMLMADNIQDMDTESNYTKQQVQDSSNLPPPYIPQMNDTLKEVINSKNNGGDLRISNIGNMFDPSSMNFVSPLNPGAMITDEFSSEKGHFGVDVADKLDTPVKSVLSGTVILATWSFDAGYTIAVQQKNNYVSFYKHNSKLLKKTGAFVKAGEAVAIIGNTGQHSSGPHLHFELWYNTQPVNPKDYIKFN
jgi:murein DD-endopeptidase MepM/ murein hydrolase activator NlpD